MREIDDEIIGYRTVKTLLAEWINAKVFSNQF
jgi:hypothetical protein